MDFTLDIVSSVEAHAIVVWASSGETISKNLQTFWILLFNYLKSRYILNLLKS